MSSPGVGQAVVAKHPDIATQSSGSLTAEGDRSPREPSASSKGSSSRLRRTVSSTSSASTSQSEGGRNSCARAAVRLNQLERLKAQRQSAQTGRAANQRTPSAAALERRQLPGQTGSRPEGRPSRAGSGGSASMPQPRGVATAGQRSTSRGYLDRYAAACVASGKDTGTLERQGADARCAQPEEQVSPHGVECTRSGETLRLSSAESRTGTSEASKQPHKALTAAHYDLAESGQEGTAARVTQCSSDTAPTSSQASVASQPPPSVDSHGSNPQPCTAEPFSPEEGGRCMNSVHKGVDVPGLAEAERAQLPSKCPQAPSRAKPLPQADAPVCSPQAHPEGSHASSASPAQLRSPLPAPGMPASSAGVLFVQPLPETEATRRVVGIVEGLKDAELQTLPAQPDTSSLQRLVNVHAYAAAGPIRRGHAAQQPLSGDSIPDSGPAKAASLDRLRSPLTSVEEGPAGQFWKVQKKVGEIPAQPAQRRPRGLPKLLAGLCSCFAPQPQDSPSEPTVVNLCATPGVPGSGEIFQAVLDCSEAMEEEPSSIIDTQPSIEPRPPAMGTVESAAAVSLQKQASFPTATIKKRPSLPKAAQDQGSLAAGLQKPSITPANLQQQHQQQESSVPEPETASTWSPPPDQELVPFVSSTRALFSHALPGDSGQADVASQDSIPTGLDRVAPVAPAGDDSVLAEERQLCTSAQVQGGITLRTQTSLADLLQSEDPIPTAPVSAQRCTKQKAQERKQDVSKWSLPSSAKRNSLRAFLERQHPSVPSALLDPRAPAPWRSSPSRIQKPSTKQAPSPTSAAGSAGPRAGTPPRRSASPSGQGSPLHVPAYQREGSPALAALAKNRGLKEVSWKQTQAWSPAKTSIALVRGPAKHPTGSAISIACTAAPGQAAELASQRAAAADMSAPAQPACGRNKQSPKEATPASKRAVHATISQLHKVSQTGRTSLKPPQSNARSTQRGSAVPNQTAGGRSGRVAGGRSPADAARRGRHAGRAKPSQQMPHLQAAMWGPGLRTNALLESGGSMGSGQSMQASRIAMQSIGEAQRAASRDRSRSVASTRATAGARSGTGVTALERRVLQQYLSARQLRDEAAAERGVPSPSRRYSPAQPPLQQQGMGSGELVLPESSTRANTGLSASLEAELQDLERHWEDLDRATAQDAAEAQPAARGTEGHDEEEEERQAQKKVASVVERWESRSISADALRHMRDRATTGRCASSADDSASDAAQGSGKGSDEGPAYVTLDMLEQLSSPAEKLAGPGAPEGADLPEHSSRVSTDMESICEARTLPDSHSPLSSATSSLSHRGPAVRSAEDLPFASESSLMADITAAASPAASLH